ncbi:MAG TPA: hypothetical protein VK914_07545 [bacterium]|jgi:hypothetical protein|nr:hypothetical protein [bacterium]
MKRFLAIALVLALAPATLVRADEEASSGQPSLDQRVNALEGKLAALSPVTGTALTLKADISPYSGIGIYNSDGSYGIQFSGLIQEDSRNYLYKGLNTKTGLTAQPVNEFVLARARLQVDGYLGPRVHLRYQEDFSNNGGNSGVTGATGAAGGDGALLLDAYGELKLAPWTLLRVGQFKEPVDLERQRPTAALDFVQYSYTANLVVDRSQGALLEISDPKQVYYLAGGAFDGAADAGSTPVVQAYNGNKDAVAKAFIQPFNGIAGNGLGDLGLGIAGTAGNHSGDPISTYKSLGQLTIVTPLTGNAWTTAYLQGAAYRYVPQAYWFWRNLSLLGEFAHEDESYRVPSQVNDYVSASKAWQAQLGWVVTGEHTAYNGWRLDKGSYPWGGLQLVARVQGAAYDEDAITQYAANNSTTVKGLGLIDPRASVTGLTSWSLGLNYIPVNDVEFQVDWDQTNFQNGGVNNLIGANKAIVGTVLADRPAEQALQVRGQFAF